MPVKKIKVNGQIKYRYGQSGKAYSSRKAAERQGLAIRLSQLKRGKKVK